MFPNLIVSEYPKEVSKWYNHPLNLSASYSRLASGVTHAPSKSLSVMTVSNVGEQYQVTSHRAAKSCDLDCEPSKHFEQNYAPQGQPYFVEYVQLFYMVISNVMRSRKRKFRFSANFKKKRKLLL